MSLATSTTSAPSAAPFPSAVATGGFRADLRAIKVVLQRELIRFGQDRVRFLAFLVQPVLFLFVLGAGLGTLTGGDMGDLDLQTFMFPGILATSTLFTAVFSAISIVWDREFGFLREMLVAPIRRSSIIIGKALGGALVATLQGVVILALGPLVDVPLSPLLVVILLGEVFLLSFVLCSLGLVMVARIKDMQAVMGLTQMMILPLSFLSGALYPLSGLPDWLSFVVRINPVTYGVQPVRHAVFDRLDVSSAVNARLAPPITWWGWDVPVLLQIGLVAVIGLALLTLAVREFSRVE